MGWSYIFKVFKSDFELLILLILGIPETGNILSQTVLHVFKLLKNLIVSVGLSNVLRDNFAYLLSLEIKLSLDAGVLANLFEKLLETRNTDKACNLQGFSLFCLPNFDLFRRVDLSRLVSYTVPFKGFHKAGLFVETVDDCLAVVYRLFELVESIEEIFSKTFSAFDIFK